MSPFLKKIFYIFLYGGLFFVLERYANINTAYRYIRFSLSNPLMNFVSVVYGPIVGGLSIAFGELLTFIVNKSYDWIAMGCAFINCAAIGFSMRSVDIAQGFFQRKDRTYFNTSQTLCNIIGWTVLFPLLNHFIRHTEIWPLLQMGFWNALSFSLSNSIVTTLFLSLYARTRISAANFYRN